MTIILMNDKYINPNVIKISITSGELGWPAIMWKHPKAWHTFQTSPGALLSEAKYMRHMGTKINPLPFARTISPLLSFYTLKFYKKKLTFAAAPDETSSFSMTAVLKLFHSVWTSPNPSPLRLEWEAPHLTACDVTFRYVGPNSGGGFTQVGRQKNNC